MKTESGKVSSVFTGLPDDRSLASMEGHGTDSDYLARIIKDTLRPLARSIDADGLYPKEPLKEIARSGVFRPLIDQDCVNLLPTIRAGADVAGACVSTAFCMWCQSALIWYLRNTDNVSLRQTYLVPTTDGAILGGTGLSNPMKALSGLERLRLHGEATDSGYRLRGVVPWVSNIGPGHPFGVVFGMPNGPPRMALISGEDSPVSTGGVRLRSNDRFAVLQGTATITAKVDTEISDDMLLSDDADAFLLRIRAGFVLLQMGIGLGIIAEACRLITASRRPASTRTQSRVLASPEDLRREEKAIWQRLEAMLDAYACGVEPDLMDMFRLRLDTAELALDASTVAQLYLGASGLVAGSRVERLRREAAFFAILTPTVRHLGVALERLSQQRGT